MAAVGSNWVIEKHSYSFWQSFAKKAHYVVFGEDREDSLNRYNFVITARLKGELTAYFTAHEMDSETMYIQHGGAFPNNEKTIYVYQGFNEMVSFCLKEYKRVSMKVENTNQSMLKLAIASNLLVCGFSVFKDKKFVELIREV